MDLACVDVNDLAEREDFFIIGNSYQATDTKLLSF